MLTPSEAIELLNAAARARVDLHNEQPFLPKLSLEATIEVRAAELIEHYQRRVQDLLEANNRYLDRAQAAEAKLRGEEGSLHDFMENTRRILSYFRPPEAAQ